MPTYELKLLRVSNLNYTITVESSTEYPTLEIAKEVAYRHINRVLKNAHYECDIHEITDKGINRPRTYKRVARLRKKGDR
jgi:hypothetical protein